ncbi:Gammaaminobutyric acid receptor subunit betalike [Caligus rogercresseyi]|uniref:Gammaaminobutyric acid receptor subunit betalike n=2 Tax=Caligus rogercresseyi TaxID=217165 RepID=A0A7T8GUQ5_CALRO|nr:Gammaaminobutyric acid receptor subunit betalike [Caligus rogercresseyi]
MHCKGSSREKTNPECDMKDLNKMFGMTASDIDKYSRVIFPVTFTCFQLMYWIIYQHLSDDVVDDLKATHTQHTHTHKTFQLPKNNIITPNSKAINHQRILQREAPWQISTVKSL